MMYEGEVVYTFTHEDDEQRSASLTQIIIDSNNNNNNNNQEKHQCKQMSPTKLNTSDKLMSAAALLNPNLSVKLVSACAHCDVKEKPTNIRSSF